MKHTPASHSVIRARSLSYAWRTLRVIPVAPPPRVLARLWQSIDADEASN